MAIVEKVQVPETADDNTANAHNPANPRCSKKPPREPLPHKRHDIHMSGRAAPVEVLELIALKPRRVGLLDFEGNKIVFEGEEYCSVTITEELVRRVLSVGPARLPTPFMTTVVGRMGLAILSVVANEPMAFGLTWTDTPPSDLERQPDLAGMTAGHVLFTVAVSLDERRPPPPPSGATSKPGGEDIDNLDEVTQPELILDEDTQPEIIISGGDDRFSS